MAVVAEDVSPSWNILLRLVRIALLLLRRASAACQQGQISERLLRSVGRCHIPARRLSRCSRDGYEGDSSFARRTSRANVYHHGLSSSASWLAVNLQTGTRFARITNGAIRARVTFNAQLTTPQKSRAPHHHAQPLASTTSVPAAPNGYPTREIIIGMIVARPSEVRRMICV